MPFRLIGHDSADQYLADGITQEVNSALSNLSGLRVIAQSSVTPVDVSGKSARDIGTALGAEALVEGEVQRGGNAIRVRFRLVDPATEEARWSQQYDQTTGDVFRIQSEVAARVAGLLRIQLAERESRSLGRLPTTNPAAYDFYLRARAEEGGRGAYRARLDSAVDNLTSAVRLDSSFAAAWALRARDLIAAVFLFDADASKLDQAESDIVRAIALDSTLAIAWDSRSQSRVERGAGVAFRRIARGRASCAGVAAEFRGGAQRARFALLPLWLPRRGGAGARHQPLARPPRQV